MSVFARQTNRYAKLANIGDSIIGTILDIPEPKQSTKYNPDPRAPKVPDFWESKDGGPARPKLEIHLLLQTDLNDGPDEDGNPDDGERRFVVPIFYKDGSMMSAIQDAMRRAGAKDLDKGGRLGVRFIGHDPESANPQQPRKLFEAMYEKPAAGGGVFQAQPEPVQQQPAAQPAQQWQQPQAAAPQPGLDFTQPPFGQAQPAQQWQQPQAAAPAPQQGWQPQAPQAVNQGTGEVQGWGQQPAEPPRDPGMYQQPANPTPVQQQAAAAFNGTAPAWQPPAAAAPAPQPAAAPAVNVDVDKVRSLISQGAPDGYIMENTGASLEAITAIRNI